MIASRACAALVALLLLLLVGCARGSRSVVLEWRGSEQGYALAVAAADEWASVCGAAVIVGRGNGGVPLSDVEGYVDFTGRLGVTRFDPAGSLYAIEVSRRADEQTTIAHELGHALGIEEHAASGLMAAKVASGLHVTSAECDLLP